MQPVRTDAAQRAAVQWLTRAPLAANPPAPVRDPDTAETVTGTTQDGPLLSRGVALALAGAGAGALAGSLLLRSLPLPARIGAALLGVGLLGAAAIGTLVHRSPGTVEPPPDPVEASPSPGASPTPPPAPAPVRVRVAQLNAHNLFDTVDDPRKQDDVPTAAEHALHLEKLARTIAGELGTPDVVTLEEVENIEVLQELASHPLLAAAGYRAVLLEGSDPRGIDSALLYRAGSVELLAAHLENTKVESASGRKVNLFTRPPLVAELRLPPAGIVDAAAGARLTVVVNHFTSKLQGADGDVRRERQGAFVGALVDSLRRTAPAVPVLVTGDFNAEPGEPPLARITTTDDGATRTIALLASLEEADRYTWRDGSTRALFDHIFATPDLATATSSARILHINTTATAAQKRDPSVAAGSSDHDPVLLEALLPSTPAL